MKSGRTRLPKTMSLVALGLSFLVLVPSGGISAGFSSLTKTLGSSLGKQGTLSPVSPTRKMEVKQGLARMPLSFIQNQGQLDNRVSHYLQGSDTSILFTSQGVTFSLAGKANTARRALSEQNLHAAMADNPAYKSTQQPESIGRHIVKLDFVGANNVNAVAVDQTEAKANYFKGNKHQWKTGVSTSSKLVYRDLWPGIDLIYSGTGEKLKYDFYVSPGADPSKIKLAYRGADSVSLNPQGQLNIETPQGSFIDDKPLSYQEINGKRKIVNSSYSVSRGSKESTPYGFSVGEYDRGSTLVIDPAVFVYAGYIGGDGGDGTRDVAVDGAGAAYVSGGTSSTEPTFPETAGPDLTYNGGNDAFIVKISPSGSLVYAGYIGGSNQEDAWSVAVDSAGAAYLAGTSSSNEDTFPVSGGPMLDYPGAGGGLGQVFIAKVNPSGASLGYAGYIISGYTEFGAVSVAVDSAGAAYVAGVVFEITAGTFPSIVGPRTGFTCQGNYCAFISKVKPDGTGFVYSSLLSRGFAYGVDVDPLGGAYVVGGVSTAQVGTFPFKVGPDLTSNGGDDTFVLKVKPDGSDFDYAGLIGGAGTEQALAKVAVDINGAAYVVGTTTSSHTSFPDRTGPDLIYNGGSSDAYIAKVKPTGLGLSYAGYIGGSGTDEGYGVAVDGSGAYVVGTTTSTQTTFPVKDGPDLTQNGGTDIFVTKIKPSARSLTYSGFIGGSASETIYVGVATDGNGGAYVSGNTPSTEASFPVLGGPDLVYNGAGDAFVAKISSPFAPKRPPADFDGNGTTDVSLYRGGTWYVKDQPQVSWGGDSTDKAVPGYYDAGPTADIAVYRTATGAWYIKDQVPTQWGGDPSDIPVPGDYNGDGITDLAVYRKSTGTWWVKDQFTIQFGGDPTDIPVPADYDGDRITDIALWRKSTGTWYIKDQFQAQWGGAIDDVAVPGDYDNDGVTDLAVYRTSDGIWYIRDQSNVLWGGDSSDIPVPGDYNNDGKTDIGVFRKSLGAWYFKDLPPVNWGGDPADKPLPLPSSIRD